MVEGEIELTTTSDGNNGKVAFVFPGAGSQYVGMGRDLYENSPAARRIYETADEVLGFSLSGLSFEGPEDTLVDAMNSQPAMLTASMASLAALREQLAEVGATIEPAFTAGHSQGEYAALVAAGALSLEEGLRLIRERGRLINYASEKYPGGMAAVMGLDDASVEQVCEEARAKGQVVIANYNCPGQLVVSGEEEALIEAMSLAKARGAKKVVRLAVTFASHSPLMVPASTNFAKAVMAAELNDAYTPVVANLSAHPITSVDDIRQELIEQLCHSVLWTQSIQRMIEDGVTTFLELGAGNVLTGLTRRISRDVRARSIGDMKSIAAFIASRD